VAIPDDSEFPLVSPRLKSYDFPASLVSDEVLKSSLADERIHAISNALTDGSTSASSAAAPVRYVAPWTRADILPSGAFDMIYSQAALEHVDQLDGIYEAMHGWLKPGGVMSHDIDLSHHRIGPFWNSHWTYSPRAWRLIRGRRAWLINRQPHSKHIDAIRRTGFEIVADVSTRQAGGIDRADLAAEFQALSDDDLTTIECYVLAVKN
jgi:SAM-dependent methyltransferase